MLDLYSCLGGPASWPLAGHLTPPSLSFPSVPSAQRGQVGLTGWLLVSREGLSIARRHLELGEAIYLFIYNIYLFLGDRETEHEQGRGREREGGTESEAGSRLRAVRTKPKVGLKPTNREIMT